ncbi:hypothetical protein ACFFX1_48445 [Dactylosporangium sucinum]|uniref:Ankyrin n=1 Tax=Dactylosporangium sucinum TaxID=1424081 RepID=A0A917TPI6_9ACTN|nr:hypothetical protein [Dactylosporangium sucinum]GGM30278.1 hypothetical protein GCM10007977_034450 [Dactylosporangium sucinum]
MLADAYEIHLTVLPSPLLAGVVAGCGWKYTRIVLDRGDCPDQPMLTLGARGSLPAARSVASDAAARLASSGLTVTRVKIEGSPEHPAVDGGYFEHHVKLLLAGAPDAVREVAVRHGAHVSRNARRTFPDGRSHRFVTQRCYDVARAEAARRLAALLADLSAFEIVEVEEEFVVVDSNPAVDAGWLS